MREDETEEAMRAAESPKHADAQELAAYIDGLVNRDHSYGTCVYAMSLSAVAAFNFVASRLGVTGFQASCADMDVIRRTRRMERFQIVDYNNLLYPQTLESIPSVNSLMESQADWLKEKSVRLIADSGANAHPNVLAHWKRLSLGAAQK